MNIQEEMRINGYQPTCGWTGTDTGEFFQGTIAQMTGDGANIKDNVIFLMSQAYTYGVICGKREERAKRKGR